MINISKIILLLTVLLIICIVGCEKKTNQTNVVLPTFVSTGRPQLFGKFLMGGEKPNFLEIDVWSEKNKASKQVRLFIGIPDTAYFSITLEHDESEKLLAYTQKIAAASKISNDHKDNGIVNIPSKKIVVINHMKDYEAPVFDTLRIKSYEFDNAKCLLFDHAAFTKEGIIPMFIGSDLNALGDYLDNL